jgi:hypothetical protein
VDDWLLEGVIEGLEDAVWLTVGVIEEVEDAV